MQPAYVHGYDEAESQRLADQAATLEVLLHHDTAFPADSVVLEAGCGVGAQTVPLVRNSPGARITCLDISEASLAQAEARVRAEGLPSPAFRQGDLQALPYPDASFDHVFLCFVLEHLRQPAAALIELRRVLRPGGGITVIEGDHGSTLFHPDDQAARAAILCQVALQRSAGRNAEIGRRLYPLLASAGLHDLRVSPRQIYVDASRPLLVEGFIRRTFTAMVAAVRDEAIRAGLTSASPLTQGQGRCSARLKLTGCSAILSSRLWALNSCDFEPSVRPISFFAGLEITQARSVPISPKIADGKVPLRVITSADSSQAKSKTDGRQVYAVFFGAIPRRCVGERRPVSQRKIRAGRHDGGS